LTILKAIGFDCLRYLSKRNLSCHVETQYTPTPPQHPALLNERGEVSVDELAKRFETSEVTIRKDLAALESNGLLLRRYGGAITMPQELVVTSPSLFRSTNAPLPVRP
jgi:DNA-binding transcriptional ArsR family regulator